MIRTALVVVWTVSAAAGCRNAIEPTQTASWSNAGRLCVAAEADRAALEAGETPTTTLEADGDLVVVVTMSDCETCAAGASASCSIIERASGVFEVRSEAAYVVQEEPCPEECAVIQATCDLNNVPPGTYSFEHGGDLLPIEIPSSGPAPCAGETAAPDVL